MLTLHILAYQLMISVHQMTAAVAYQALDPSHEVLGSVAENSDQLVLLVLASQLVRDSKPMPYGCVVTPVPCGCVVVGMLLQDTDQKLSPYQERMKHLKEIQRKTLEERKRIEEQVCQGQDCVSGAYCYFIPRLEQIDKKHR